MSEKRSNNRVFIRGQEVVVPEGCNLEFVADGANGFQVCITQEEERSTSSVALPGIERRTHHERTYYDVNGKEIVRVTGVSEWVTTLDKSALPFDYRSR
jgi:hypothetical protein